MSKVQAKLYTPFAVAVRGEVILISYFAANRHCERGIAKFIY